MKKGLIITLLATGLFSCVSATERYTDQLGIATYWYQNSGEAKALYYQGFESAKKYFDQVKVPANKKKAVVVDIDETIVDNSEHSAYQFLKSKEYDAEVWTKWVNAKKALATPGAVEYNNYVNSHGATMLYVSNRMNDTELEGTIENLKKLGFTNVSKETMFLKTKSSKKEDRYKQIESLGYEIVQIIGDNLNDFTDATYHKTNEERSKWVNDHKHEIGTKYIILPNPLYGGFDTFGTPEQQIKQRKEELRLNGNWWE